jgi:hypothetical protein
MNDDPVIGRIKVMSVLPPAAGPGMDFDITFKQASIGGDDRVQEIGAGATVIPSRVENPYRLAVFGQQFMAVPETLPPDGNHPAFGDIDRLISYSYRHHRDSPECEKLRPRRTKAD